MTLSVWIDFFSIGVFFHGHWRLTGQQEKGGGHLLFYSTTSIHLWTFRHLDLCYCHVTYAFQSQTTLYSCMNVKELLAWNKRDMWSFSDCNGIRTHKHLVRKRTLIHLYRLVSLAKWLSVLLQTWLLILFYKRGCGFKFHTDIYLQVCMWRDYHIF